MQSQLNGWKLLYFRNECMYFVQHEMPHLLLYLLSYAQDKLPICHKAETKKNILMDKSVTN